MSESIERLLSALDPEQRQVAETLRGPVRVLAGAGTGKTRAITHRIAHGVMSGVYAPTEVLAVTFTTRAAGELRQRLRQLGAPGVQARTFHSAALRQLRYFWPHVHGTELPTLTESKIPMLAAACRNLGLRAEQALLRDLASEIEWAKVSNVGAEDYPRIAPAKGRSVADQTPETIGRVIAAYEQVKRDQGRMDMEDVLLLTAGVLASDERVAAQVRRQYKWFVVDEFQDVSPLQSALLDLWLGGRDELCVVGDPAQTIYSFAGADADYLRDFPQRYPGTTSIELVRNYRSTPQIVETANTLLSGTPSAGVELRSQQKSGSPVRWVGEPDEVAEARSVADRILRLQRAGTAYGEMAVLFRINAQSETFEDALADRGIPYIVRGAARFFERREVREAVTRLRGAARSGEGGDDPWLEVLKGVLGGMGWTAEPPTSRGQVRDRWESFQALADQAEEFATERGIEASVASFVEELDRRATEQHAPTADGVTLATFHAAKGLEWDAVFCCGVQDGTVPIVYAEQGGARPDAVEEERRLLYVGVTRARRELMVSWAAARNPGQAPRRQPSRFIVPMLPASQQPQQTRARTKVARCRDCLQPLSTAAEKKRGRCAHHPVRYDEALFDRLKVWRLETAREAGEDGKPLPAYVVFTDATLELIAEVKPTSMAALAKVSGVGPSKIERYGDAVLALVAEGA
ncbi:ATP-dependent helicase [Nocardioides daeguensis]|uniref:DNA 3'-5' helicase n=1 Tax=Nocardioides daeguensis TaxID=908359 RepID=A0ABP6VRU3_9ACTN|nr:ATP-dependent DNA helicase UvrD2 [Nocardioides daeguensis]MBV6728508.1 ATP-dependent DNA helicase UvrD2 [Nocardioides daeguensis]MCR1773932.1 ATP-dependent DNA helicase UvrD2 [Nocardioides daeguensis]